MRRWDVADDNRRAYEEYSVEVLEGLVERRLSSLEGEMREGKRRGVGRR